ncbi:hypothetical protein VNI00_011512 [Paramarasmius palmivorus]|uniref:Major facilitator superfamily (MFS) profile domain-containing protein n=1 Tax=Paramarasmius palmivorus TaxID=297713 RepID=A0AAW0CEV7_9AGAR
MQKPLTQAPNEAPVPEADNELEVQTFPENNYVLVFTGLNLLVFVAAMDQTIVSAALPTIVRDLGGGDAYSWAGTAYIIAAASLTPLNGKLSDIVGRKPMLFVNIAIFLIGSALCGASQSFIMFIISRAIQGIGAGGIMPMMTIIIGDILPLESRATYSGILGSIWGLAALLGPLIGGALTDRASWRWAFWIVGVCVLTLFPFLIEDDHSQNIPIGVVATGFFFPLKLNPLPRKTFAENLREFDFIGLTLIMTGVLCLLVGFQLGQDNWANPQAIATVVFATLLLIGGCINELCTRKSPIIPPRLLKTRTTTAILGAGAIHSATFMMATYFLPTYFQSLGSSATRSGIEMLPFSMIGSLVSFLVGITVGKTGKYRPVFWGGFTLMTLGYALMAQLDDRSSRVEKELYLFVAALGAGTFFQIPTIALQAAMPIADMATTTTAYMLVRSLSSSIALSVGSVIFTSTLRRRLAEDAPDYHGSDRPISELANQLRDLILIEPPELRQRVIHAYTKSISMMWLVCTPLLAVGLCLTFLIRGYSLKRPTVIKSTGIPTSSEESGEVIDHDEFGGYRDDDNVTDN